MLQVLVDYVNMTERLQQNGCQKAIIHSLFKKVEIIQIYYIPEWVLVWVVRETHRDSEQAGRRGDWDWSVGACQNISLEELRQHLG